MNLIDSSCWLEWFAHGPKALEFRAAMESTSDILVPTIVLLEVYRRLFHQRGEDAALRAAGVMRRGVVVDLDADMAILAARIGHGLKLALADSVILATARTYQAALWTLDAHFQSFSNVGYFAK